MITNAPFSDDDGVDGPRVQGCPAPRKAYMLRFTRTPSTTMNEYDEDHFAHKLRIGLVRIIGQSLGNVQI